MYQVGLTGGIASGKSTVSSRLASVHDFLVVDADHLAREVVAPGTPGLAAVVEAFGPDVLTPDGAMNRAMVGERIFADPHARAVLEGIIHPQIAAKRDEMVANHTGQVVIHDIPLLFETGMAGSFDEIVVIHTPAVIRVQRLIHDRQMPAADAWQRINAQISDEERLAKADTVIMNTGTLEALADQVDALAKRLASMG